MILLKWLRLIRMQILVKIYNLGMKVKSEMWLEKMVLRM